MDAGPRYSSVVVGARSLDTGLILDSLRFDMTPPDEQLIQSGVEEFLQLHGFLDGWARTEIARNQSGNVAEIRIDVHEGERVRVGRRLAPCLRKVWSKNRVDDEVDGTLEEVFPNVTIISPTHPSAVSAELGGAQVAREASPLDRATWSTWTRQAWGGVADQLVDVLRADGFKAVQRACTLRRRCRGGTSPDVASLSLLRGSRCLVKAGRLWRSLKR